MAICYSGRNRELEQATTMHFPRVTLQPGRLRDTVTADFRGCAATR